MIMKRMFVSLAVLTLVLALVGQSRAAFFGDSEMEVEQKAVTLAREIQRGGYSLVTTAELKKWLDEKKPMLLIDTMPFEDSYRKEHIPGAVQFLFPVPEMPEWKTAETAGKTQQDYATLLGPDKDRLIVIYCGFVKCTRSHNGAMWAKRMGYTNVFRYSGGIKAWKEAKNFLQAVK